MMASTRDTTSAPTKHDVYLSCRDKDTRTTFTAHLRAAFTRNGVDAFIGNDNDRHLDVLNKISECPVSVVIFSESYTDSASCLDELVKIMECRDKLGNTVLPVFLGVEPNHVRNQAGAFGDAFNNLLQSGQFHHRELIWRHALVETANLSGWDSMAKSQEKIVEEIVNRVEKILDQISLDDQCDGFVGISRVDKVETLLCIGSSERVYSIGIWGMGGIGKTRIANLLYSRLWTRFEGACFVANVKAKAEREGLDSVQKDMILQLLGSKNPCIGPPMLSPSILRKLRRKKLLLVLDDVNSPRQLRTLLGQNDFYGLGSRIVVTSRDKQVLKNGCTKVYEVEKLNRREALLLFKLHALKQKQPTARLLELSKKAVIYTQGLPLALEVLGCNLYDRDDQEWEKEVAKLEEIPEIEINDILRSSYDGLDEKEKNIFLDIACIFRGWMKDRVESILDGCGFYAGIGLSRLVDKALITISDSKLWMHDLLQQMGQDIVIRECMKEPGRRSRLWRWKDIDDVLTRNMGTEKVEAISLDLSKATEMVLRPTTFVKMLKLRVLNFDRPGIQQRFSSIKMAKSSGCRRPYSNNNIKLHLPEGLEFLPNEIRFFCWRQYPLASLPLNFHPEHLVELNMSRSQIKQLWSGLLEPNLPCLKYMDLTDCKDLIKLPDFSKVPNLEKLYLSYCESLVEFPLSVQHLSKLQDLGLSSCLNLAILSDLPQNVVFLTVCATAIKELPKSIGELKCLQILQLFSCPNLTSLPDSFGNLHSLKRLDVSCTAIRRLPDSFCNLTSLELLRIDRCWNLDEVPENLGNLKSLQNLNTSGSPIRSLPSSVIHLTKLKDLICTGYRGTQLPLSSFSVSSPIITGTPNSLCLFFLKELDFQESSLECLPASIKQLPSLQILLLNNCKNLSYLPELPSSLQWLGAANCTSLGYVHSLPGGEAIPKGFIVDFFNCINLEWNARFRFVAQAWQRFGVVVMSQYQLNTKESHGIGWDEEDDLDESDDEEEDPPESVGRAFLCIPGTKVPEWFEYSGVGSSLEIKLGSRLLDLGQLAFCIVIAAKCDVQSSLWVQCKCTFLSNSGQCLSPTCGNNFIWNPVYHRSPKLENVILWYGSEQIQNPSIYYTEVRATFEFYASDYEILECGVTSLGNNCNSITVLPFIPEGNHGNQEDEEGPSNKRLKLCH